MKRNITQVFLLSLFALCTSMGTQAQSFFHNKSVEERIAAFEKKKTAPSFTTKVTSKAAETLEVQAMKSPALRKAAKVAEESKDVVLLDSVISDTRCDTMSTMTTGGSYRPKSMIGRRAGSNLIPKSRSVSNTNSMTKTVLSAIHTISIILMARRVWKQTAQ